MVLLYDALLLAVSARVFRNPMWVYPASALGALAFAFALGEGNIPAKRQGWWLIGLAANYLLIGWALRRVKLSAYASGVMTIGFALIAFGLPPSSRDQVGAMWGYARRGTALRGQRILVKTAIAARPCQRVDCRAVRGGSATLRFANRLLRIGAHAWRSHCARSRLVIR